ncbi:MAG: hypothetical protein H8D37_00010 [Chloroflexi bacterium]|nr:hypothetical protein [Chloroflexota bacterium]
MKPRKFLTGCVVILIFLAGFPSTAMAQDGLPGTPGFGYSACLDLEGHHIETAIQIADNYGLEWITIDFDWAKYWPDPDTSPNWAALDVVMGHIDDTNLAVMISITQAPIWAFDSAGPSGAWTSELVLKLARRYPENILALEPFPAANTARGWGTSPNPAAYAELLKTVHTALANEGLDHPIIAAGIDPSAGRQDALNFLLDLYNAGSVIYSPVVSLRLPALAHDPQTLPGDVSDHTLRFYEEARQVMLDNGHQSGLIWITRFDWEPGQVSDADEGAIWLQQAYLTMHSQLYIGVASFYCLNDPLSPTTLLSADGEATSAFDALGGLIAAENNHLTITHIINLSKSIQKNAIKPDQP